MDINLFNRYGSPIAYITDDDNIFLINGSPVAYIYDDSVYSFNGKHLGFYINKWIYDLRGNPAFFTKDSTGGPIKPIQRIVPVKGIKRVIPIKHARQIKRIRPILSIRWSDISSESFFE